MTAPPIPFTRSEIAQALGTGVVARALDLLDVSTPRLIDTSKDGTRFTAVVPSTTGRGVYQVTIALSRLAQRFRVKGFCTCPIGQNCKHVAAVLLMRAAQPSTAPPVAEDLFEDLDFATETRPRPLATNPLSLPPPEPPSALPPVLSAAARLWIERLDTAVHPRSSDGAEAATRRLVYVLDRSRLETQCGLWSITVKSIGLSKDGTLRLGDQRVVEPEHVDRLVHQGVRYLSDDDRETLRDLAWLKRQTPHSLDVVLKPGLAALTMFRRMLATGRLHHRGAEELPLIDGPPLEADAIWIEQDDGRRRLTFAPREGDGFDAVVALDPPYYIRDGLVGPLIVAHTPAVALEIARAPALSRAEASLLRPELERIAALAAAPAAPHEVRPREARPTSLDLPAPALPAPTPQARALPLPEAIPRVEAKRITPTVVLRLYMGDVRLKERFRAHAPEGLRSASIRLPLAALSFDYGGELIVAGAPGTTLEVPDADGALYVVPRDRDREDAAAQWLRALRLIPTQQAVFDVQGQPDGIFWLRPPPEVDAYGMLSMLADADRYIAFSAKDVPRLEKAGWRVRFDADYPYRIATGAMEWWADVGESARIDWFSFELGVTFDGHRVNLIPQLASLLARLPQALLDLARKPNAEKAFALELAKIDLFAQMPDGRLLRMPADRMAPILRHLLDLVGPRPERLSGGRVSLHRAEAPALTALASAAPVTWGTDARALVDLGRSLQAGHAATPVSPPPSFVATLRPYQQDGLAWLAFLRESGFGGVLADDMGLGKTVQTLAFLALEKAEGRLTQPALIVAPTSVLPNWQAEAAKFAPDLTVLALRGPERKALYADISRHDIVLTTYPLLARDHESLLAQSFHVAILDEAQAIKNPKATVAGIAQRLNARHRFTLTGTPLENNLGEVWSLFEFLSPGLLGDQSTFRRQFQTPIEKHGDRAAQSFLSRRLKPFLLRRTKAEVATELPPKTEIVERIELEGAQRDLYETVRALMEKRVRAEIDRKGLAKSHIIFLDALLKLRQICCDPRLLKMDAARSVKQSAKRERLMAMLPEMVAEGRRILLFSQFTSMLDLIAADLKAEKIPFVTLRGDTDDRAKPVKAFQAGEVPVFLLSLKAGGTGLNLTAADTVIHYDPWWNPAVEIQATDRAYRIGQDKPVFVYKLLVTGSIEDAIELLKQKKSALAAALYADDASAPFALTEADIAALFAPIPKR